MSEYNSDILRALAVGLDRLGDGDPEDLALVERVERDMADLGWMREGVAFYQVSQERVAKWRRQRVEDAQRAQENEANWQIHLENCRRHHPNLNDTDLYLIACTE